MMTLKQARRMVAKSRRRVWRLARRLGVDDMGHRHEPGTPYDNGVTMYAVETFLPGVVTGYLNRIAVESVAAQFTGRLAQLRQMEIAAGERAWVRYRQRQERAIELPALDHGQDGDELLQDIADYYAGPGDGSDDIHPCPACGSEMERAECHECGGEGGRDGYELMEEDPLWYDLDDYEVCSECGGEGHYWQCPNAPHGEAVHDRP